MKYIIFKTFNKFCFFLYVIPMIHCLCACSEERIVRSPPEKKEALLVKGMKLSTAKDLLLKNEAKIVEAAYSFPWKKRDGKSYGYHEFYNLKNGYCIKLRVDVSKPVKSVVGFEIASRHYTGKLAWMDDRDRGKLSQVKKINLRDLQNSVLSK